MVHQKIDLEIGQKPEWKPMAKRRPLIEPNLCCHDIRPGWRYLDQDGSLVEVEAVRSVSQLGARPATEVHYHRVADGRRGKIYVGFARAFWKPAPAAVESDDQRATRQPSGATIVYMVVGVFIVAALVVLARWR